jgi:LacI family sucrose operon transcriptional repressor
MNLVTMKDVAERAGVSLTTVSRVMNNRGAISEKTRKKVFRTMKELSYQPNEMARSLMTKKTHIVGLIIPAVDHPYFSMVVDAIESLCAASGYKLLLCTSDHSSEKELEMSAMLRANKVDGVLLYSQGEDPAPYVDYELPVVSIDKIMRDVPSVLCDNAQGGMIAAKTLIEGGSLHPVVFGFEDSSSCISVQRLEGFKETCVRMGVEYRAHIIELEDAVRQDDVTSEEFDSQFLLMLEKYPDTDGFFFTNEIIATRALMKLRKLGRSIPDELQLVGYDNTILSKLLDLTTIVQPITQMCELAFEILLKRMEGALVPSNSVLPVTLMRRGSTR